ncbi:MAG: glycosyltransferase [Proteobacteria bacterium]|nr:glycosyltransferase [Pseudomonadota bacterium]MBS0574181.1 glycosyltransferase [Pseudomonadota bacterium]
MISVIIPHFNQPDLLARCLGALVPQARETGAEVIVIDNGSREVPRPVVDRFPGVRLDAEATPGPGPARNRGVTLARGEILAFIDADCVPAPGWLAEMARLFDDPGVMVLGGDVRILHHDLARPTAIECYESEFGYRMEHYIRDQNFTGTGNLAMRRPVFDLVGGFAGIGLAEDRDWGQRAFAKGIRITWAPGMLALHPARTDFAELTRKWDRHTAHDFELALTRRLGRLKWLARTLAVAASPLGHAPRVFRSDRIEGGLRGRLLALAVLTRIRLYRARLMVPLIFARDASRLSARWRKG